jgi:alanine dehydrogenase
MHIGVPKEIKNRERRVSMTPDNVRELGAAGHTVRVQRGAGIGSAFADEAYQQAGATLVDTAAEAWDAELVVKVKEPQPDEYPFMRQDLTLFTYLHLAAAPALANELRDRRVHAIAYETVQALDGSLPLLAPMSQVAGRVAVQMGAGFLQAEVPGVPHHGRGVLMGGISGVPPARVVIIGGGNVGEHAARAALGLGAQVTVLDVRPQRLLELEAALSGLETRPLHGDGLCGLLPETDLLVGAALIAGEHAPHLLDRAMLGTMPEGAVFVDVSIDQGGISVTSHATTFEAPAYVEEGVIHCCLPNLPAAVPLSSTLALTHATFPYVQILASGIEPALADNAALRHGINVWDGAIRHAAVADALGLPFVPWEGLVEA